MDAEKIRLAEAREGKRAWKFWGPYLSDRQWGTVREYFGEAGGDVWNYFTHDQARSRAYRNGEDGLAGISDESQRLCFALCLWNGKDEIVKERLFGLANAEGNHGEDVKEYYFHLDSTPTHSYMKFLYKYPQRAFPYADLVLTNQARSREEKEYELLDTGVFQDERYFDVFVEYAKDGPEDVLIRLRVCNRGPEAASLHVLPTLWFRNTWTWLEDAPKPELRALPDEPGTILARHAANNAQKLLADYTLRCDGTCELLFTENETNNERIFGTPNPSPYVKDAFNEYLVNGNLGAVNPQQSGSKACAHYRLRLEPGEESILRLRLSCAGQKTGNDVFGEAFERIFASRIEQADEFFASLNPDGASDDEARVMRQALAGMMWNKQYYYYDVAKWLKERGAKLRGDHDERHLRNRRWFHMINNHVISMPDKWEYPWYASWDLAFHAVALSVVDCDFAKEQLSLMLHSYYMHPSGQIPAYEWNFSAVNPPVNAWATLFLYRIEQCISGKGDLDFLKRSFAKLMLNFTWWVNRKDRYGKNIFEGGFLGLDNIGVFDRGSKSLPQGGILEQADGTAWMALYCQNMIVMSLELATHDSTYDSLIQKFLEHFLWIALGMNHQGPDGMWDEEDGFYYDVLRLPDGNAQRLKVRSMVGLLPLCAVTIIEERQRNFMPQLKNIVNKRLKRMPELRDSMHPLGEGHRGVENRDIMAVVNEERLRRILSRMLDENEFLSPYGIRSLSRHHLEHPYVLNVQGEEFTVGYVPGDSDSGMFGGNSNWRGPVWVPVNLLLIRALLQYFRFYGDSFKIECPTGSGRMLNLYEVAREISNRLTKIFLLNGSGQRPVFKDMGKFCDDPNWRDNILFFEYFHGDDGSGLGASHQTGWTGTIAMLMQLFGNMDPDWFLNADTGAMYVKLV